MKYCLSAAIKYNQFAQIDQLRTSNQHQALAYLEKYPNSTILLDINDITQLDTTLLRQYPNLRYSFVNLSLFAQAPQEEDLYRYMLYQPIDNFNTLTYVCSFNVSDIYLTEPLTFQMPEVVKFLNNLPRRPLIHVNPAQGPADFWTSGNKVLNDGINYFWILPQHTYLYEDYIDVFDFSMESHERQIALIDIYLRQDYQGPLKYLVRNATTNYNAGYFTKEWATKRINCGQRCMRGSGHCSSCIIEAKMAALIDSNKALTSQ